MADVDAAAVAAEQGTQTPTPEQAQPDATGEKAERTFTKAEVEALVRDRLAGAQRKAEEATKKATADAEAKALREQGEFRTLYEKEQARAAELEQRARSLEIAGIRRDVAARLQLPVGLVDRLRGDTEDEITADAQALLAVLPKPPAPNINAGDVSSKTQTLPGGLTEAALRDQAVRFGVKFEDFKAAFVNGK
jgi:hypothetical protein